MEKNVHDAICEIEILCQEKLLVYQKLLGVFRKERKAIIKADVATLWTYAREKQSLADEIHGKRDAIYNHAREAGLVSDGDPGEYSLNQIVQALPVRDKRTLVNLSMALNHVKRRIASLSRENRLYLEESLKTIEDLVRIITRNCVREERYGRETYTRQGNYRPRMAAAMRGEV